MTTRIHPTFLADDELEELAGKIHVRLRDAQQQAGIVEAELRRRREARQLSIQ